MERSVAHEKYDLAGSGTVEVSERPRERGAGGASFLFGSALKIHDASDVEGAGRQGEPRSLLGRGESQRRRR